MVMNPNISSYAIDDADDEEESLIPSPQEHRPGLLSTSFDEFRIIIKLAIPVTASDVLTYFAYLLTTAQVGHMGSHELSALTLGRSIFHLTGLSL